MNKSFAILLLLSGTLACQKAEETSNPGSVEKMSAQTTLRFSKSQTDAIGIKTGSIQQVEMSEIVKANGYLEVPPQYTAVISPMITGYVRKINFIIGDDVGKGQVMAELESMEFIDLQQQFIENNSRLKFLENDFERQKLLRAEDAVSEKKYLLAESQFLTLKANLDALTTKLVLLGANIEQLKKGQFQNRILLKSPISGSVKSLDITLGQHVDPTEEVYEVIDPSHLHLELNVYEKDISKIRKGQHVTFSFPALKDSVFHGEVFLVGSDLSEVKRSANVHVHIHENPESIRAGMYATAKIQVDSTKSLAIPSSAIAQEGNTSLIFSITRDDMEYSFERIPVTTGLEVDGMVELLSLEDRFINRDIVVSGAFHLLTAFAGTQEDSL